MFSFQSAKPQYLYKQVKQIQILTLANFSLALLHADPQNTMCLSSIRLDSSHRTAEGCKRNGWPSIALVLFSSRCST